MSELSWDCIYIIFLHLFFSDYLTSVYVYNVYVSKKLCTCIIILCV